MSEIERLFSAATKPRDGGKKSDASKAAPKSETIHLVMIVYFA